MLLIVYFLGVFPHSDVLLGFPLSDGTRCMPRHE